MKWKIAAAVLIAALGVAGIFISRSRPKLIILIVVDTLRADHVSAMGYPNNTTPNIDRIAANGALFENAFSNIAFSIPSFATLMTSLYPESHGLRDNHSKLSDRATTLAEIFSKHGWYTAAVIGSANLNRSFGLNQGFSYYDDDISPSKDYVAKTTTPYYERTATEVTERAKRVLRERPQNRDMFFFIQYFDPHKDYRAPRRFHRSVKGKKQKYIALYDAEVSYADEQIGVLLKALQEESLFRNAVLMITADHGEGLGDHGRLTHGGNVFDEQLHVPMVLHGPGVPEGLRLKQLVQLVDVPPTLLELAKIKAPRELQGNSMVRAFSGAAIREFALLSKSLRADDVVDQWGARTTSAKLISTGRKYQFYDLINDAGELQDVYPQKQSEADLLANKAKNFRASLPSLDLAEVPQAVPGFEPDEAMKALGYVDQ